MLDEWMSKLRAGECISEHNLKRLCTTVSKGPRTQHCHWLTLIGGVALRVVLWCCVVLTGEGDPDGGGQRAARRQPSDGECRGVIADW